MTKPVKPISAKTATPAVAKPAQPKTVKIGNVEFRKDQIEEDKTKTYTQNGKKINTVFVKPGVQIDFPDQAEPARVESLGLREEWYNPDSSHINIYDLHDAKIYGNPNKRDYIGLYGNSSDNEIFVDKKESWYVNGDMRKDRVDLGSETSDNTVHMDEKDETRILYNQPGVTMNNQVVQDEIDVLRVQGKGESAQESQLQDALGEAKYQNHKLSQKHSQK
ncbi:MAG: hypothetical protein ACI37Q_04010 [Candidatus Gastranaerophilaceae bacterium]